MAWSTSVAEASLPLPPGFEDGPNTGTYAAQASEETDWAAALGDARGRARRGNAAAPAPAPAAPGRAEDQWHSGASDPWGGAAAPAASAQQGEDWAKMLGDDRRNRRGQGLVGEATSTVTVEKPRQLEDGSDNPAEAYLAMKSWEELCSGEHSGARLPSTLLDGIYKMGFVKPSKIQEWAIPIAMSGSNIIGQAQNGSGKTAAFALAMLCRCDPSKDWLQGLCICPTRELATQNHDVIGQLGEFMGVRLFLAVPQTDRAPKSSDAHIVVGTPGKLGDLLKRKTLDGRWAQVLVIDEADVMINEDNQMAPQVMQVRRFFPEELQILLFSATWPDHVQNFAKKMVPRAYTIRVDKEQLTLSTITQTYIKVGQGMQEKSAKLSDLYMALSVGQSIIFVNTKNAAFDLAQRMKDEGHSVSLICGTTTGDQNIDITYRDTIMSEFRSGVTKVLITTDVLSRGIDVPAVTLVVNYDVPVVYRKQEVEFETYMHRIGRTGRFGLKGIAVNFVTEDQMHMIASIQNYYQCRIHRLEGDCEEIRELLTGLR